MITTNLRATTRRWFDLPVPAAAGISIFVLYIIIGLMVQLHTDTTRVVAVPTPALPLIIIATSPPAVPPTAIPPAAQVAAVLPNTLRRAVVAYGAPDASTAIGAIEQGRVYHILARFGAEWLQANVDGSGVVWLRADQVLDLPANLADLKPTPAPIVITQPVYVSAPTAEQLAAATPQPLTVANDAPPTCASERQCAIQQHYANEHQP